MTREVVIDHGQARHRRRWVECPDAVAVGPRGRLVALRRALRTAGYAARLVDLADGSRLEFDRGYGAHIVALRLGARPACRVALAAALDKTERRADND